jgi:hypothetical protein
MYEFHYGEHHPAVNQSMKALVVFTSITVICIASVAQQVATNVVAARKTERQPVWFQKYDLNKNGVLELDERKALQTQAENQRRAFILSMDKNGDGKIDSREQWLAKSNRLAAAGTVISTNVVK